MGAAASAASLRHVAMSASASEPAHETPEPLAPTRGWHLHVLELNRSPQELIDALRWDPTLHRLWWDLMDAGHDCLDGVKFIVCPDHYAATLAWFDVAEINLGSRTYHGMEEMRRRHMVVQAEFLPDVRRVLARIPSKYRIKIQQSTQILLQLSSL